MKTFLLLAFSFSIALSQAVNAEVQDQDQVKAPKTRAQVQTPKHVAPQHVAPQHVNPQHVNPQQTTVSKMPHINQTTVQANQYHPKVQSTARVHPDATIPKTYVPRMPPTIQADNYVPNENWQKKNWQKHNSQDTPPQNKNWQNQHNQDSSARKKNWQNQNWQNQTWNNNSWEEARRRCRRDHHHRDWWRSRYSRFALFGTGYYFWDGGYWFPAYGYDTAYNTYAYDEPIYGYNDLDPAQVIANVQTELQRLGYYRYAVDGEMGPMTRAAIANYQRDTGLSITAAIDGPTLQSLGLE